MFKLLRSKAKIFYWVIAVSFVLFIFLAWGMQYSGSRQPQRDTSAVGSINGAPITAYQWDNAYQNYVARLRQQSPDRNLTANQRANATQQVWEALLQDRIEEAAIADFELTVTPEEILDVLRRNPPPELLAQYTDESGNPDLEAYYSDLSNPSRDWSGVENYLRHQLPRQKLQQLIVTGATVTEAEIRETYLKQTGRVLAEYIGVAFDDITLEDEPPDGDIAAYYESHAGQYHRPARARLQVVRWTKEPSAEDRNEVAQLASEIKEEIVAGELDFADAAAIYSQDGTAENGGDLGTFDRQRMVKPFSDVAFSQPVGQISDPVETRFGYHLIEVLEQNTEGDSLATVHARHILLRIDPGESTLSDLFSAVEDFRTRAEKQGLTVAAEADSLEVLTPDPIGEGRDIPGLRNSLEASLFAFNAGPGSLSPIFSNEDDFYLVQVEEILPEGPAPLDEVRAQVEQRVQQERKRQLAVDKLAPAVEAIRLGQSFAEIAAEYDLLHAVTDTITAAANVPDIGYGTAFNAAALEVPLGTLVPRLETRRGVFAFRTLWKEQFSEEGYLGQKARIRAMLMNLKQRELQDAWYEEQMANAEIVDNRFARRLGGA